MQFGVDQSDGVRYSVVRLRQSSPVKCSTVQSSPVPSTDV